MKSVSILAGLLLAAVLPLCAQSWTPRDSVRLRSLLHPDSVREIRINPRALEELEQAMQPGALRPHTRKSWMEFDESLPDGRQEEAPPVRLTLRPYTANTRYDWDPVYQRKIDIDKPHMRIAMHHTHSRPEARRTAVRPFAGSAGVGGLDLMHVFTRDFLHPKARRRRARTLEVLRSYGDSATVHYRPLPR